MGGYLILGPFSRDYGMCIYKPDLCVHSLIFSMQVQVSSETKDIGIVCVLDLPIVTCIAYLLYCRIFTELNLV